jgi:hypothetical protein
VQGARAVLQQSAKQSSGLSAWLAQLTIRTHSNVAAVALANKLARMAWAVLAKNEPYRPPMLAGAATECQTSGYYGVDDFLPGLLANYEMTQRSNPALSKPVNRKSLPRLHY